MALTTVRPQGMGFNTGRRNMVINGAMQVAQRGDVTGKTGDNTYGGPDHFSLRISSIGTWSISQSSIAPDGFANSYKIDCTTADASLAASDRLMFTYRFEGQDVQQLKYGTASAKSVTLSFYVRSNKTGTYVVDLFNHDPSTDRHCAKTYTISSADTWEYKTITFAGDTSQGFDDDNGRSLDINWFLGAGTDFTSGTLATSFADLVNANRAAGLSVNLADSTDNEWLITGIQLEVGENASDFEHRSYGEELSLCQRYYQKSYTDSVAAGSVSQLGAHMVYIPATGNTFRYTLVFEDQMRANPTATFYVPETGTSGFGGYEASGDTNKESISTTFLNNKSYLLYNTGMGYTGSFYWQYQLDAEL